MGFGHKGTSGHRSHARFSLPTLYEARTGYSTEYCGTLSQVKAFADELKSQGGALGQKWTCVAK